MRKRKPSPSRCYSPVPTRDGRLYLYLTMQHAMDTVTDTNQSPKEPIRHWDGVGDSLTSLWLCRLQYMRATASTHGSCLEPAVARIECLLQHACEDVIGAQHATHAR